VYSQDSSVTIVLVARHVSSPQQRKDRRWCPHKLLLREHWYRVRQKYLKNLKNSCEWNLWCGEFVLQRPSSGNQSISVAMERCSVEHRVFAVETIFKNNDSIIVTQLIFRRLFNIHQN
jgi:hypothetical protein